MRRLLKILAVLAAILVIAFVVFRTPDTDPEEMRAKYGGEPSQFVELDTGSTVHVRDEGPEDGNGDRPAIILVHGSGADLHTWQPWVEDLRRDYRVIRYDQIGHGLTGPAASGQYQIADFAEDIGAVADKLGVEKFVLVGSSMGGRVAMAYALENNDRLDGLVLVGASGAPIASRGSGNLAYTIAGIPGVRQIIKYVTPRSMIERSLQQSVSNQDIVTPEAIDRYWELLRYPGNRAAALVRLRVPRQNYSEEQMGGLAVPTLLVWGEEDTLVPFEVAEWYEAALPNATLVRYPDIGHIPMEEAPERSVTDLREWLDELPINDGTG